MEALKLLESIYDEAQTLEYGQHAKGDSLARKAEMVTRNIFGEKSMYVGQIKTAASFFSQKLIFQQGKDSFINIVNTMKEELLYFHKSESLPNATATETKNQTKKIFIVHGHDESMKQSVARTIEKLGLTPIILHEQPSIGRTIIEKFTENSDVNFAIVLLSPDDIAHPKNSNPELAKYRARQNVILELGYYIGKLGRNRVIALFNQVDNFEMPSDYSGVLFIPYDSNGRWQFDLIKELNACGYSLNANNIL